MTTAAINAHRSTGDDDIDGGSDSDSDSDDDSARSAAVGVEAADPAARTSPLTMHTTQQLSFSHGSSTTEFTLNMDDSMDVNFETPMEEWRHNALSALRQAAGDASDNNTHNSTQQGAVGKDTAAVA